MVALERGLLLGGARLRNSRIAFAGLNDVSLVLDMQGPIAAEPWTYGSAVLKPCTLYTGEVLLRPANSNWLFRSLAPPN